MIEKPLINRVANSGILTINLEDYYPKFDLVVLDIKEFLFKELLLKEKDFRQSMKSIDWTKYQNKILLVDCSSDAIIPMWAYMLIAVQAKPFAEMVFQGNKTEFLKYHYSQELSNSIKTEEFLDKRVVIKGCSDKEVPTQAYAHVASLLQPHAQSIMFGEPCSTVPIFKRPRDLSKRLNNQ